MALLNTPELSVTLHSDTNSRQRRKEERSFVILRMKYGQKMSVETIKYDSRNKKKIIRI